jgi:hypothetical protein
MSSCPRITITLPDGRGLGPWFDVKEPIPSHSKFPEHIQLPDNAADGLSLQDIRHAFYSQLGVKGNTSLMVAGWYIASPQEDADVELCRFCRHINFDVLFHTQRKFPRPHNDTPILFSRQVLLNQDSCGFCRVILAAYRASKIPRFPPELEHNDWLWFREFSVLSRYHDVSVYKRYISDDRFGSSLSLYTEHVDISWIAENERTSDINRICPTFHSKCGRLR